MSPLENIEYDELRQVIRDRLHGLQAGGPPLGSPNDPEPYRWLVEQFHKGTALLQARIKEIVRSFIPELLAPAAWPTAALDNLFPMLQECGKGLEDEIFRLVINGAIIEHRLPDGKDVHAGLLQCLKAMGRRGTPEFWLEQYDRLGADYGGLVFGGLLLHGLECAVKHLPRLASNEEAVEWVDLCIPDLIDLYGLEMVRDAFRHPLSLLRSPARATLAAALSLPAGAQETHPARLRSQSFTDASLAKVFDLSEEELAEQASWYGNTSLVSSRYRARPQLN